jgi:hypothetical protein
VWGAAPDDRRAAGEFVRGLLESRSAEDTATILWKVIEDQLDRFPTALAVELVTLEGPERLRARLTDLPMLPIEDLTRITGRVLAGQPVRPVAAMRLLRASKSAVALSAMLWDRTRYVPIDKYDDGALDLAAFLASPVFDLDPIIRERIAQLTFASDEQRRLVTEAERLAAYQTYALRHGSLAVNDPYTGRPATYLGCFQYRNLVLYRLRVENDVLLVTGTAESSVRGVYLPADDLFLTMGTLAQSTPRNFPGAKAHMSRALVRQHRRVGRGITETGDEGTPTGVTMLLGGNENFAHQIWNSFGALEREILVGNLPGPRNLVSVGSECYGPVEDLYPELESVTIKKRARGGGGIGARFVADPERLHVRLGTGLVMPEACDRVARAADRHADDPELRPLMERVESYRCPIYLALRIGDKAWADAATEVPKLINHVLSERADVCVLLDGFSIPSGTDHNTDSWGGYLEALEELVSAIQGRVADPDRVMDLIGLDLLSSVAVLRRAGCYVTPVGTAHHKVDWLADIPGVVYVSEDFNRYPRDGVTGFRQRIGSYAPRVVVGKDLPPDAVRHRRAGDLRERLSNFTLSWTEVWAALEPLLGEERP